MPELSIPLQDIAVDADVAVTAIREFRKVHFISQSLLRAAMTQLNLSARVTTACSTWRAASRSVGIGWLLSTVEN